MSFLTHLECPECERDFPADVVQNLCPFNTGSGLKYTHLLVNE
jgi:hypothetical protein